MKQQTFGTTVAALRKARGMTQLDLADRMGVTDKAVSKWERDLSFPDTASLPKLAADFTGRGSGDGDSGDRPRRPASA